MNKPTLLLTLSILSLFIIGTVGAINAPSIAHSNSNTNQNSVSAAPTSGGDGGGSNNDKSTKSQKELLLGEDYSDIEVMDVHLIQENPQVDQLLNISYTFKNKGTMTERVEYSLRISQPNGPNGGEAGSVPLEPGEAYTKVFEGYIPPVSGQYTFIASAMPQGHIDINYLDNKMTYDSEVIERLALRMAGVVYNRQTKEEASQNSNDNSEDVSEGVSVDLELKKVITSNGVYRLRSRIDVTAVVKNLVDVEDYVKTEFVINYPSGRRYTFINCCEHIDPFGEASKTVFFYGTEEGLFRIDTKTQPFYGTDNNQKNNEKSAYLRVYKDFVDFELR